MNRPFSISLMIFMLTACAANTPTPLPTPTPTPGQQLDLGGTAVAVLGQDLALRATEQQMKQDQIMAQAQMTATQMAIMATATERAMQDERAQRLAAATATYQVWQVTAEAAMHQATSTAIAQSTENSVKATREAVAWEMQATAQAANVQSAELALARERTTNTIQAWGPWAIVLAIILGAGWYMWKKGQVGVFERDPLTGMMAPVMVEVNGRRVLVRPDLMPSAVLDLGQTIHSPALIETQVQADVTRRAQAVEAIAQLPAGYQQQARGIAGVAFENNNTGTSTIRLVEPTQVRGWLEDIENQQAGEVDE